MRKFLIVILVLTEIAGAQAPTPIGGTSHNASSIQTITCTYTPTTGNTIAAGLQTSFVVTGVTAKDNNNNSLTIGTPALVAGTPGVNVYPAFGVAITGQTSIVWAWTNSASAACVTEEYSGVNSVNLSLSPNTATGTAGTTDTISTTPTVSNSRIVCFMNQVASPTVTVTVGTLRQGSNFVPDIYLIDNTESGTGTYTPCTATWTGTHNWGVATIELIPAVSTIPGQYPQVYGQ